MPRISAAEGPSNAFEPEPVPDEAAAEAVVAPPAEEEVPPGTIPVRPPLRLPPDTDG